MTMTMSISTPGVSIGIQPLTYCASNFPPFCHVELPEFTGSQHLSWTPFMAERVYDHLSEKISGLIGYNFCFKQKLYYFKHGRVYPFLVIKFATLSAMYKLRDLLEKAQFIPGLDLKLNFKAWETDLVPLYRKMLSLRKVPISAWFTVSAKHDPHSKSTLNEEYIADWTTLSPVDPEVSKSWATKPTILSVDGEMYSPNHNALPNKWSAKHVLYMISGIFRRLGDKESKRYLLILGPCNDIEGVEVIRCKSELDLLRAFENLVNTLNPDILTGYNILGFDYPYMDARLGRKLKKWGSSGRLKDKNTYAKQGKWKSSGYGHQEFSILMMAGRIHIDMLPIIRRDYKLAKYDLDYVSHNFLGRGKHPVKAKEMFVIYEQLEKNPQSKKWIEKMTKVARYCVEDSNLALDLLEKTYTWFGLVEMSSVVGVTIMEVFTRGQQIRCISQIYDLASSLGYVIDYRANVLTTYSGGYVKQPEPGVDEDVITLDFSSLYPSIIEAFNIDYTTLIGDVDCSPGDYQLIEFDEEYVNAKKEKFTKHYSFKFYRGTGEAGGKGKGIVPQIVHYLVSERRKVRKLAESEKDPVTKIILDKRQLALKVSANSVYGFLGVADGKLPLMEAAMSVTAMGRILINRCNDYLMEKYKARIVYNDTDSTMFVLPFVKNHHEAIEWGKKMEVEVSSLFPPPLRVEHEKSGRMLRFKKKKYAYWTLDEKTELLKVVIKYWLATEGEKFELDRVGLNDKSMIQVRVGGTGETGNGEEWIEKPVNMVFGKRTSDDLTTLETVVKVGDKQYLLRREITPDIMVRGIVLARRDNCSWQRSVYSAILNNVITRVPMRETYDFILEQVLKMYRRRIPYNELLLIRGLGADYKSDTYFMKIFSDELRRIGKAAAAGDRLEYMVVKTKRELEYIQRGYEGEKILLGYKMRLPESYLEQWEGEEEGKEEGEEEDEEVVRVEEVKVEEVRVDQVEEVRVEQVKVDQVKVEEVEQIDQVEEENQEEAADQDEEGEPDESDLGDTVSEVILHDTDPNLDPGKNWRETLTECIDTDYYVGNILQKCIEQLFSVGYRRELEDLSEIYEAFDYAHFFEALKRADPQIHGEAGQVYEWELSNGVEPLQAMRNVVAMIRGSKYKARTQKLYSKYITRFRRIKTRICEKPIQNIIKLVTVRKKVMRQIKIDYWKKRWNRVVLELKGIVETIGGVEN